MNTAFMLLLNAEFYPAQRAVDLKQEHERNHHHPGTREAQAARRRRAKALIPLLLFAQRDVLYRARLKDAS